MKEKTAELVVNTELAFQNEEKENQTWISCCIKLDFLQISKRKSAAELAVANELLLFSK
jgi:hypothetical protein